MSKTTLIIVLMLLVGITISAQQNDFPKLTGSYLGQKPPGKTPEIFAPGIISLEGRYELNSEFSLEGDEFYFELSTTTPEEKKKGQYFYVIMVSKRINGVWTKPEMVPFSGEYATMDFCFSPDGKRMYFTSDRPNEFETKPKNNIWYVEREGDGWSETVILGPPVYKPEVRQGQHSLAANGTLYFRSGDDLFYSKNIGGRFTEPVIMPDTINSPYAESKPYVAPDESFLLFVRYDMPESINGGRGLYISFRRKDGSWAQAQNTNILGSLPKFSPDGKYFFFSRGGDIYWVDASVICDLKPDQSLPKQMLWSGAEDLYAVIFKSGLKAVRERFGEIKSDKRFEFAEKEFLKLGNKLRSFGRVEKAVQFLDLAKKLFPNSSEYWQNLGYCYIRLPNKEKAVECLEKSIALNEKNGAAIEQLRLIDTLIGEAEQETRTEMKYLPGINTGLKGPYLGQKLPGKTPELFAPGIVSVYGSNENTVTLTPDGKELYFGKESGIWVCRQTEEGWTTPENTGFLGYEMWISPRTQKMYYSGYQPGIWVMERKGDGWGEPKRLVENGMFSTLTDDETLYTTVFEKGVSIGRYIKKDSTYSEPEILGSEVNTPQSFDAHPNVAPDGSFFIFDSDRPGGKGLYICFKEKNGSWTQAKYMGEEFNGICSTFSPDGKYLFFMKNRDIYWVDAKILDKFKK